jgi:SPP1 family predicted phage head-tail adaptor
MVGTPPFEEPGWTDTDTVRAEIWSIKGDERTASAQSQAAISHRIRIRAYPGLTAAHRIKYGTRTFNILFVNDREERGIEMLLDCFEVVGKIAQ